MLDFKKITVMGLSFILLIGMVGCSKAADVQTPAPQQATIDLGMLHTQVAQTVIANITVEAALHPSLTPTAAVINTDVPTETPPAIITVVPSTDVPAAATQKPVIPSSGGGVVYPTVTKTLYVDSAKLIDQVPADGYSRKRGETFPAYWEFLNTGMRSWNTDFYIKFVGGDVEPESGKIFHIPGTVKQQDSVRMDVTLRTPDLQGKRYSNWVLINDDGVVIYHFNLQMVVP
jgi:hypothetical protein